MAKRNYKSPLLLGITPGSDPTIVIGGSQGTIGDIDQYSFTGIPAEEMDLIYANCDDTDFAQMDTNNNYVITKAEYDAWKEQYGWF